MFDLRAPTQAAASAGKAPATGAKSGQPVGVQVDEKLMEQLEKDLSPACSKRYVAMMKGEGPQMHSFNQHAPKDSSTVRPAVVRHVSIHVVLDLADGKRVEGVGAGEPGVHDRARHVAAAGVVPELVHHEAHVAPEGGL